MSHAESGGARMRAVVDLRDSQHIDVWLSAEVEGKTHQQLVVANDVEVRYIRGNGESSSSKGESCRVDAVPLPPGNSIELHCRSPYRTSGNGVLARANSVFTNFQPTGMSRLFPCIEDPASLTDLDWEIVVPDGWTAVGPTIGVATPEPGGGTRWTFESPHRLASGASGFAAGDWVVSSRATESVDGRDIHLAACAESGRADESILQNVVNFSARALRWLEVWLGQPFPFSTWTHVFVDDHPSGALETAGCPSFDSSLLEPENPQRLYALIVHELVHAWFGDLIAPSSIEDLWIAEGPASYLTVICLDHIGIEQGSASAVFDLTERIECARTALSPFTHPVRPARHVGDPADCYDSITYFGAAVLFYGWAAAWGEVPLRSLLSTVSEQGARSAGISDWCDIAGLVLTPEQVEQMRAELTCSWSIDLMAARAGHLGAARELAELWIGVIAGDCALRRAVEATADAITRALLPEEAVERVLEISRYYLHEDGNRNLGASLRDELRLATSAGWLGRGSHSCLHGWIELSRASDQSVLTREVLYSGRDCCVEAWRSRRATWGMADEVSRMPDWSIPDPQLKEALWESLAGEYEIDLDRVGVVAHALKPLDHADANHALIEKYVAVIPIEAARLSRLQAKYLLSALYPWFADPQHVIALVQEHERGLEGAALEYLRWVEATAQRTLISQTLSLTA